MNNKFIFNGFDIIVSDDHGNLRVMENAGIEERLKLENNLEKLSEDYINRYKEYTNLINKISSLQQESNKKVKLMLLLGVIATFGLSVITGFSTVSAIISILTVTGSVSNIIAIKYQLRKELKIETDKLAVASFNVRNTKVKMEEAKQALDELLVSDLEASDLEINKEYEVDNNFDILAPVAEYIEPEKEPTLKRIRRVCREKLDKKRN